PRKNVAPELVRAKQIDRVILVAGAEQMDCGRNEAEQFVFVAGNEKMKRLRVVFNNVIGENTTALFVTRHNQMNALKPRPDWRMERVIRVQAIVVIRRDKTGEER